MKRDAAAAARVRRHFSLVDATEQGAWFCKQCQTFTERVEGWDGMGACAVCASPRVAWWPPICPDQPRQKSGVV